MNFRFKIFRLLSPFFQSPIFSFELMIMAADVSSLLRILNEYKEEQLKSEEASNGKSNVLITREFLGGGCSKLGSKELDLDLQVPSGWEKRLDMASGKIYLQRCSNSSPNSSSSLASSDHKHQEQQQEQNRTVPKLQDLNFPPTPWNNPIEESGLELKLVPFYDYQSVCTLDKVKSALERAGRESGKKRSLSVDSSTSPPSSSSIKEAEGEEDKTSSSSSSGVLYAAGCPGCLLYVLISKRNPKCPRCDSIVPSPLQKKPRIDLNASSSSV